MQLLQHLKNLTRHPKNAKDLKGLILQLAIQGKLTAIWRKDNPDVESASELLNKIRQEKKKLIKEKKVRKTTIKIEIREDEKYLDVPIDWEWARIIEVGNLYNGNSVNKEVKEIKYGNVEEGYPYLGTKDINYGFEDLHYENGVKIPFNETTFKIAHKNTPLICSEGGSAGKKCGITKQDICFGNKLYALEQYGDIQPVYILSLYQTPVFFNEFQERMTGIIGGISINSFGEIPIPLPPLEEQQEIVRVVEILFKEVEELEQLTKERIALKEDFVTSALRQLTTENTATEWDYLQNHFKSFFTEKSAVKKLREAVLQLAVQGKLTVDWRKNNPDTETATELLKRIQKVKAQLIKDKKIKKENPLPPISDDEIPYELPECWMWCRLGEIINLKSGQDLKPFEYSDTEIIGLPYITGASSLKNEKVIVTRWTNVPKSLAYHGDLLITCKGSGIGKMGWLEEECAHIARQIMAISVLCTPIDFIKILMDVNAMIYRKNAIGLIPGLDRPTVLKTLIGFPPLEEQKAIVEKVNIFMLLCDQLEQEIEQSKNLNEQLMKSILREA